MALPKELWVRKWPEIVNGDDPRLASRDSVIQFYGVHHVHTRHPILQPRCRESGPKAAYQPTAAGQFQIRVFPFQSGAIRTTHRTMGGNRADIGPLRKLVKGVK